MERLVKQKQQHATVASAEMCLLPGLESFQALLARGMVLRAHLDGRSACTVVLSTSSTDDGVPVLALAQRRWSPRRSRLLPFSSISGIFTVPGRNDCVRVCVSTGEHVTLVFPSPNSARIFREKMVELLEGMGLGCLSSPDSLL